MHASEERCERLPQAEKSSLAPMVADLHPANRGTQRITVADATA
ncbi:hypothetical protein [Staphylococcus kloosii]|nr:hypothetical protein [Staphylococcus kloosii]